MGRGSGGGEADGLVELRAEAEPAGDVGEHLVGVEVDVVEQHAHVHGGHPEVAQQVEVAGRSLLVLVLELGQTELRDGRARQLPLLRGGDVGEQDPHLGTSDPDDHEEVLVDGHHPDRTAVARESSQRPGQRRHVDEDVVDELDDLPDPLLAVGGHREVDTFDLLAHDYLRSTLGPLGTRPE
jgi:hypothetical protein